MTRPEVVRTDRGRRRVRADRVARVVRGDRRARLRRSGDEHAVTVPCGERRITLQGRRDRDLGRNERGGRCRNPGLGRGHRRRRREVGGCRCVALDARHRDVRGRHRLERLGGGQRALVEHRRGDDLDASVDRAVGQDDGLVTERLAHRTECRGHRVPGESSQLHVRHALVVRLPGANALVDERGAHDVPRTPTDETGDARANPLRTDRRSRVSRDPCRGKRVQACSALTLSPPMLATTRSCLVSAISL